MVNFPVIVVASDKGDVPEVPVDSQLVDVPVEVLVDVLLCDNQRR